MRTFHLTSTALNRTGKTFDMKMNAKKITTMLVSKDVNLTIINLKIDSGYQTN